MSMFRYRVDREIPVLHKAEVIVVGGGPGGLGAAVMAARAGADVLLIEQYGCLGGMASVGEIHPFMGNHVDGKCLDRPVYVEWVKAMQPYLGPQAVGNPQALNEVAPCARNISKDAAMLGAEDLCLAAGVRLLYHHALADVAVTNGRIDKLVLFSKSGYTAAEAKVYVDCTGDGDLAARAGCRFEQGGPSGHCQPMTLCFKLGNVDKAKAAPWDEIQRLYKEAKASGEVVNPREDVLMFTWLAEGVVHFNTTRVIQKSGTDGVALSEAEIEARRQLRQMLAFLRKRVKGYENAYVYSIGHQIGVRETRRVKGLATVTRDDFVRAAKFPDAIARVNYPIDIHNPTGTGTEHQNLKPSEWYEIPYGCIVPADASNLLVGGRPISGDHATHSSFRVMPPACSIGQAAGLAAAVAARRGVSPAKLDGAEVRKLLVEKGAWL